MKKYNNVHEQLSGKVLTDQFESIKDLKFLSLATLIDVLTTAISDLNVGKAISNADQIIAEQTAITINEISKTLSSHDTISSNEDTQIDLLGE
ncbi:MAG: hypothetical protein ACRYE8_06835 [Janthinobacterium lividum]